MISRYAILALAGMAAAGMAMAGARAQTVESPRKQVTTSTVGVVSTGSDPDSIRLVNDLAAALNRDTLRILPILGQGPVEDVFDLFRVQSADIGIVPSDVLPYLQNERRLPGADQSLRYIAKIYNEEVHVLARQNIRSLAELAGKRVNLGPRDSRAYITGSLLFDRLKIRVEPVSLEQAAAVQALRRGEIAALVHVARTPAREFFALNQSDGAHFLPVPLTPDLGRTYSPSQLAPEDYPLLIGQAEAGRGAPVATIAVPMLLAVYNWTPGTDRYRNLSRFIDALFSRGTVLQSGSGNTAWKGFDPSATVPGWLRFAPAEARLKGEPIAESGSSAAESRSSTRPTARRKSQSRQDTEALFQQFHQWQQQHYPEQAESQEALFEEFLRQLQSR